MQKVVALICSLPSITIICTVALSRLMRMVAVINLTGFVRVALIDVLVIKNRG